MQLAPFTTFQLGGPCRHFTDCKTPGELIRAVGQSRANHQPFVLLGGGSNVLVSDHGYSGRVIRFCQSNEEPVLQEHGLEVSAAACLDRVVEWLVNRGLDGLTFCSGIPGTIGGALVGNAGAWGKQVGDSLDRAEILQPDGTVEIIPAAEFGFAYRNSRLKQDGGIVLRAWFHVRSDDKERLRAERNSILEHRAEKHPDLRTHPCIGSIFKNLEASSAAERRQAAGYFLEQAGAKSLRVGGAYVFPKHANIITIEPGATAEEVFQLQEMMKQRVKASCGIDLEREVRFLGRFGGHEEPPGYY